MAPADEERQPGAGLSAADAAGERAAKNTAARVAGEVIGRLASLALFAVMARVLGQAGLGAFVFAFAWAQLATLPAGFGLDRYFVRRVARDRSRRDELIDLLALKLAIAVPLVAGSFVLIGALGYDDAIRTAIYLLTPAVLIESLASGVYSVFTAHERSELIAAGIVASRVGTAAIALVALALGFGVVGVAASYVAGATLALLTAALLLRRHIGPPAVIVAPRNWRQLVGRSFPFGAQDALGLLLWRLDAVMLALIATQAAVGRYGAAYRLLEATFFLSYSVTGAFAAMYTYLEHDTSPTVAGAFQRSIKLVLAVLLPIGVALGLLAEPLAVLFFGEGFAAAAAPLRLLAPSVVLYGVVALSSSLLVSRGSPLRMVWVFAVMVVTNVVLNLVLIPPFADAGAAAAMLATEVVGVAIAMALAVRAVGGVEWHRMLAGPAAGTAVMAGVIALLAGAPALALVVGGVGYLTVLATVERYVSPRDVEFVSGLIKRRLPVRFAE